MYDDGPVVCQGRFSKLSDRVNIDGTKFFTKLC